MAIHALCKASAEQIAKLQASSYNEPMGRFRQLAALLIFLSPAMLSFSCGGTDEANKGANAASNSASDGAGGVKTNVEELSLLINIPYEAEDVLDIYWKEDKASRKLTALLRFDEVNTNKLVADLEKAGPGTDSSIETEDWFHDELRSQSDLKGDTVLKGRSFAASQFYSEPYTEGKITRINGTDFFVLELSAR